jgi:uncharacterized peroxidase-related enzyme
MSYLHEVEYDQATDPLRELYERAIKENGYLPHFRSVFSLRPDVLASWLETTRLIRSHLRLRQFELITLAASAAIGCKYCLVAHGAVLARNGLSEEQLISIVRDYHTANLEPVQVHMMDLAHKLSTEPRCVTEKEIQQLRDDGLSDTEITDVALVAAARNFYSRFFDALGTEPDSQLKERIPKLWEYVMGPL